VVGCGSLDRRGSSLSFHMIETPHLLDQTLPTLVKDYTAPFTSNAVYPELLEIQQGKEAFTTKLVTKKQFQKGETVCDIYGSTFVNEKSWTTVQVSRNQHIELNSELVYMVRRVD
jgi:hypothetical protein